MTILGSGSLAKMKTQLDTPVQYSLPMGEALVPMNALVGTAISLRFDGDIGCIHCGRKIKKTFNQGYCFVCMRRLARCDLCMVRPELCHYAAGTCREPEWGVAQCMIEHVVYLANSSGLKVGITRHHQVPTRWIDQGACQALPIRRVTSRLDSGQCEVYFKQWLADKTHWRRLLQGPAEPRDLLAEKAKLDAQLAEDADTQLPGESVMDAEVTEIVYPILEYPQKIRSHSFEKEAVLEGTLLGIKGQYLLLDTAVVNIRKYTGFYATLASL